MSAELPPSGQSGRCRLIEAVDNLMGCLVCLLKKDSDIALDYGDRSGVKKSGSAFSDSGIGGD